VSLYATKAALSVSSSITLWRLCENTSRRILALISDSPNDDFDNAAIEERQRLADSLVQLAKLLDGDDGDDNRDGDGDGNVGGGDDDASTSVSSALRSEAAYHRDTAAAAANAASAASTVDDALACVFDAICNDGDGGGDNDNDSCGDALIRALTRPDADYDYR
jgi:hypothetical protein